MLCLYFAQKFSMLIVGGLMNSIPHIIEVMLNPEKTKLVTPPFVVEQWLELFYT